MILAGCAVVLLAAGPVRAEEALSELPVLQSRDFAGMAAKLAVGARLRLENLQVAETGEPQTLVLERFEVFTSDARVMVHGDGGDQVVRPPANVYFRGEVEGQPGSHAFLARLEDGRTQGVVNTEGSLYLIGADAEAKASGGPLTMQRVDPALLKASREQGFRCGNAQLPDGRGSMPVDPAFLSAAPALPTKMTIKGSYKVRMAIETDYEFYQRFNSVPAAVTYIGNLIGFASTVYQSEVSSSLVVPYISLWTTPSDPWSQQDTNCGLMEFGHYWNLNRTGVSRTIAHFMSGKSLGGGVAWVGVLGSGPFNTGGSCPGLATDAPWGGAYGFTANMVGNFNINNPTGVWDLIAVSHEIGHNFNSPHSHCYNGLGGNASPIDQCFSGESGCYSGATSLPGPAGAGSGTIMSYCHLLSGGMSNISFTFGANASFGVQPGREAARMSSYVVSLANGNPGLLPFIIFSDDFESGGVVGPWSSKTP